MGDGGGREFSFETLELFDEAVVGVDDLATGLDEVVSIAVGHTAVLDEIGEDEGD